MASRRSVLVAGATSLLTANAGCAGSGDIFSASPPEPTLRGITLRNTADGRHVVRVRLDHDGEQILHRTYQLGPRNFEDGGPGHTVEIDEAWESGRGEFRADVHVHDGVRTQFRLDDQIRPPSPYRYEIRIEDDGDVSTWFRRLEGTTTA